MRQLRPYSCACGETDPNKFYPYRKNRCKACQGIYFKLWVERNPERYLAYPRKSYRQKLKDEVFAAYGGYRCVCCDETREVFLCLDHINDDGAEHRRMAKAKGNGMYFWLKRNGYPPIMQVLCSNCNQAKRYGPCPHLEDRKAA